MQLTPLLIDGEDVADAPATVFVPNPGSPRPTAWRAQGATIEHCARAAAAAAAAWPAWRATGAEERARLFLRLADVLTQGQAALAAVMREEVHTSAFWAAAMAADAAALAAHTAHLVGAGVLSTAASPAVRAPGALAVVAQRPLGVVLGIAPWNAPAILGLRAVAAAAAAGNCVVFKGSEFSPRTHYFVADAFRQAGFPPGVVNFLVHRPADAADVFEALIAHPAVRKCNFTGSTAVGRHIAMRAAHHLKPVLLELGGKNYALVLDDADLDAAADKILWGAFLNNGQICMSTDVVLVSEANEAALCQRLKERLAAVAADHVQAVINDRSAAKIADLVADAEAKGAAVERAGAARLLRGLRPDMAFWAQESFGPVVGVATYARVADAVALVNGGEYGLSAAIFTRAGAAAVGLAAQLAVGAVHINGPTVHDEPGLPHGGHKSSGWGRFGGVWGLQEFVQTQTVVVNP